MSGPIAQSWLPSAELLPGAPCWVDLPCVRLRATQRFYTELFGWRYELQPDIANGNYTFAMLGDRPVAGLYDAPAGRSSSQWRCYLAANDLSAVMDRTARLGGTTLAGPMRITGQGSMLVIRDPAGTATGIWQPSGDWAFTVNQPGTVTWVELSTRNAHAADRFYQGLFGYQRQRVGDGTHFDYSLWSLGEDLVLGRIRMDSQVPAAIGPHWMVYFEVDPAVGTDATLRRALELGGRLRVKPFDSFLGRIAVLDDPSGATFSLLDPTQTLDEDEGSEYDDF